MSDVNKTKIASETMSIQPIELVMCLVPVAVIVMIVIGIIAIVVSRRNHT